MTGSDGIRLDLDGPVVTVTLGSPPPSTTPAPPPWRRLRELGRELTGEVRVVLVRGFDGAFATGLGRTVESMVADAARLSEAQLETELGAYQDSVAWLRRPDLVSIAAVRGPAAGAGCQLALGCDLRVAADDASFAMPEVGSGLVPELGATGRLCQLVGYARALELCLTGRRVAAAEAYRIGLAALVVPPAELDAAVGDLASAVLSAPRAAVAETKALLAGAAVRDHHGQAAAEREAQARRLRELAGLAD